MKLSFFGKNILILGGTSELGISFAKEAIHSNLFPILTYRSEDGLQRITESLKKIEGQYRTVNLDLNENKTEDSIIDFSEEDFDYVIDLFHSDYESYISSADSNAIQDYYLKNVVFRHQILKEVSRQMLSRKKGRLVYLSSTAAGSPNPGQGFYASSKVAVEAIYRNLGIELGRKGITTATLRAGYIDCGRGKLFLEQGKEIIKKIPTRKILTVQEVVETLFFLLSDAALNINATEIIMDGGMTACK